AILLALAACLAFLAHEPLLVALGHRGARMRKTHGTSATQRLTALAICAASAATLGLILAPAPALAVAAVMALPSVLVVSLAWSRAEHSLAGELVAAVALPGAAAPVAIA